MAAREIVQDDIPQHWDQKSPPPREKSRFMYYGEHGVERRERGAGEREQDPLTLRAARPHKVGYVGG